MNSNFLSKSGALALGLFAVSQAFAGPVSQKQATVKPGSFAILNCTQPFIQTDSETGVQNPIVDIDGKPVELKVALNINIAANGQKTLDGSVLYPGFVPENGEYIHSALVEIKKLPVTKIQAQVPRGQGFDFFTKGSTTVYVEGDVQKERTDLVALSLENGSQEGRLRVTSLSKYDVVDVFLDHRCLPAANLKLLRNLSK